jgi:hypothetical protein
MLHSTLPKVYAAILWGFGNGLQLLEHWGRF